MSQNNEITTTGATYLGIESPFGATSGSMVRMFPRRGGTRKELDNVISNGVLKSYIVNRDADVLGYKSCENATSFDARTLASRINDVASPTRPWQGVPLFGLLGGESLHAGSKIVAGSTTTVLNVTATQGARFNAGDGILVTVAGVNEFAIIKNITGDALTLLFALSAVPSVGADVFACVSYFPTDTNSSSLTFQHARAQNAASQWTHNACTGGLSIETPRDGMLGFGIDLKGGNWTGPSAQSIVTTEGTQTMSAPLANVRAFQSLQLASATTRTHVPFESVSFKVDTGMMLTPDVGGPYEGLSSAMRTSFGVTADVVVRHDSAWRTGWDPSAIYALTHVVYQGSGTSRGCVAIVMYGTLSETPGFESGSNDRGVTPLKFQGIGGGLGSSANTDQARAPFLWMMG
jgi:hypothetical protein